MVTQPNKPLHQCTTLMGLATTPRLGTTYPYRLRLEKFRRFTGASRPRRWSYSGICVAPRARKRSAKEKYGHGFEGDKELRDREQELQSVEEEAVAEVVAPVETEIKSEERDVQCDEVATPSVLQSLRAVNPWPWLFGGVVGSLALYVGYLVLIKDRSDDVDRLEMDLNAVVTQLERLREMRMQPDLSDSDVISVRSFLLSLVIKQKKREPVSVMNRALALLKERPLNKREKKLILGVEEQKERKFVEAPSGPLPTLSGIKMVDDVKTIEKSAISSAFAPDASLSWWHKLPYICILQMKKTGALFMTAAPEKGKEAFALVGFEDPEEAFHAGKMPVHQQLWGVLSAIEDGPQPSRPLEDEKHFDLTWLQPKEFKALMERSGLFGVVIPAGTLRSGMTAKPIRVGHIKGAIDQICRDEKIGASSALPSTEVKGDVTADPVSPEPLNEAETESKTEEGLEALELDLSPDVLTDLSVNHTEPKEATASPKVNGFHSSGINDTLLKSRPLSESDLEAEAESTKGTAPPTPERPSAGDGTPWWMPLEAVVVPLIKPAGEKGGHVEINISIDPDVTDFRTVLFEDEREAKFFLGVLGKLRGPQTLVATQSESPESFLKNHPRLNVERIIVLCRGSLLLDRGVDRQGLKNAIRLAHVATEIKKGVHRPPSPAEDESVEKRVMKVAEDVVSNFEDRMKSNARNKSRAGDAEYQDPIEGLMHDLEAGGLSDLFGPETEDGVSAEVGSETQGSLFQRFDGQEQHEGEGLYARFVANMSQRIDQSQKDLQTAPDETSLDQSTDLHISLDELIKETSTEEETQQEDEGFEVVYPKTVESPHSSATGPRWFADLNVIYVPKYLTSRGQETYLAMTDPDQNQRYVIGFQDQKDAVACKELMKTWPEKTYVAAGLSYLTPEGLISFSEEYNVEPVVIREAAIPLVMGTTQSDFLRHVAIVAQTQRTHFSVFN